MYKTEWEFLKKAISTQLIDGAEVFYGGSVFEDFPTLQKPNPDCSVPYPTYSDSDYNSGCILSILVGPFSTEKEQQKSADMCLKRVMRVLEENGYCIQNTPVGTTTNDKLTWIIRFVRTSKASFHLIDREDN